MSHHAAPLGEPLSAEIADVRSFPFVSECVHPECNRRRESFRADFALVRTFTCMLPRVQLQRILVGQFLAAMGAEEALSVQAGVTA